MKKKKKPAVKIAVVIAVILALLVMGSIAVSNREDTAKVESLEDVISEPIGEMIGSTYDQVAIANGTLPENIDVDYYNSEVDAVQALRDKKAGSYINCEIYAQPFVNEYDDLIIYPESLAVMEYAFGFQEGSPLRDEFNAAMKVMQESGQEQEIYDKWLYSDEEDIHCIEQNWTGDNGTLNYWLNVGTPPMAYIGEGGSIEGLAIDYVLTACSIMGYNVEIKECSFSGLIPALQSGKADIAGRSMAVTEERDESIDFSEPFISADVVLLVRKDSVTDAILSQVETGNTEETGFFEEVAEGFRKTFIEENRWELFVNGIGLTMFITIISGILGTLFGLFWYWLYLKNIRWLNVIIRALNRWLSGIPVVVTLMIMYYVIFSSSALEATGVAVVTFTILFGIGVFGLLETGVDAVGKGQVESAVDLGFTKNQIFFRILLPQTVIYVMPLYGAKLVAHLMSTAIVGYIAIMDLTKVCDMIRSRTFEAFFPLIATAVIYYFLGRLLGFILKKAENRIRPGVRKSRLMKGVREND